MGHKRFTLCITVLVILVFLASTAAIASEAKSGKKVAIQFLALRFGTLGYASTFGLADLINKHSSFLKATAVETKGTIANARTLAEEPSARKNTVILNTLSVKDIAEKAKPPFKDPYDGLRAISVAYRVAGCLVTLDPKIKSGKDLVGKKIGVGKKGSTSALYPEVVLKYGYGVWDKLKSVQYLGYKESYDALRGGTLDAALFNNIIPGISAPAVKEFIESVPSFYTINIPPEIINKAREKSGVPIYPASMPARAVSPKQKEAYHGFAFTIGWWADKQLPDKVAYEITRVWPRERKRISIRALSSFIRRRA
ncbi:MAG: TAXI family TRAP transporter solute-binding subunit [Deltaproteobacteria bacterium]|nr:TAXI family TRAP transporter solute-binding subunit [Deltaproteobacteria bacterium]